MKITAEFNSLDELLEFSERITNRKSENPLLELVKANRTIPKAELESPVISEENEQSSSDTDKENHIIRTLRPLTSQEVEMEKFLDRWYLRYSSQEREATQLVALAKEHNLFKNTAIWSGVSSQGRNSCFGRLISPYTSHVPENKYFVTRSNHSYRKNGKQTMVVKYALIKNDSYTNGLNPNKVNLNTEFPKRWLNRLDSHLSSGTSFKVDQIIDHTENMSTRIAFLNKLRNHPQLNWDGEQSIYTVVK